MTRAHAAAPSAGIPAPSDETGIDDHAGYYVDEPDWTSIPPDDAIDPDALMALFAAHSAR